MLVLFETPAGYALFKLLDKGKLEQVTDLHADFQSPEKASEIVKLKAFVKFEDTSKALAAAAAICDGKLDKTLKKFLKENITEKTKLAVSDLKLANAIKQKLDIKCIYNEPVLELMRGIRSQLSNLLVGISPSDRDAMRLGLSHSFCRYKLKFSPDKVDTMIIQAIALLDELDKELNTYAMRVKEWYGWHFPEMAKIVTEPVIYAKVVRKMGIRTNASKTDLSDIISEEMEKELKENAEMSMGTEIAEEDMLNIGDLCDQVVSISDYRSSLFEYLKNRMQAIAPNLTVMVGELVGARLIAHAGSLMNLAKQPASTVQILGAEKALFRALKTKHDTPKYGLIYHASLVGQAAPKLKGKISRVLAAKTALSIRADALGESDGVTIALQHRQQVENRLRQLESGVTHAISGSGKKKAAQEKYTKPEAAPTYNIAADVAMFNSHDSQETPQPEQESAKDKKKKKKEKRNLETTNGEDEVQASVKRHKPENNEIAESTEPTAEVEDEAAVDHAAETPKEKKKKKSKKNISE